jgi:amidase
MEMFASARDTAAAVASGVVSATEVAEETLRRAELWGPKVGAFATLAQELTREQARALDEMRGRGDTLPPLAGVPCPIKDLAEVAGLPYEGGSAALKGNLGRRTDSVAQRVLSAGTLIVGKTATPEFGFPAYTEGPAIDPARTPWDLERGAGGSSGGAAAAVASGIVPVAHASDGGGSIRIPAASTGLVGLKTSRGLVPTGPDRVPGPGLVSDGVLTRTVRDTAFVLDVLAEDDPGEYFRQFPRQGSFLAGCEHAPERLTIGVLVQPIISATALVDEECRDAVMRTADWLSDLGHDLVEAPTPFSPEKWAAFDAIWATGAASIPLPGEAEALLSPMTRWLRERGKSVRAVEYAAALAAIQRLRFEVERAWRGYDMVLTPTLARVPARIGSLRNDADPEADFNAQIDYTPWTSVANLTGRPAISLPLHRTDVEGVELPIGIMLTGRDGADGVLLAVGAQLEAAHPWPLISPAWQSSVG